MNLLEGMLPAIAREEVVQTRRAIADALTEMIPAITEQVIARIRKIELRSVVQALVEPQIHGLRREFDEKLLAATRSKVVATKRAAKAGIPAKKKRRKG